MKMYQQLRTSAPVGSFKLWRIFESFQSCAVPKCFRGHIVQCENDVLDAHLVQLQRELVYFSNLHDLYARANKIKLRKICPNKKLRNTVYFHFFLIILQMVSNKQMFG